jgi:hypothetical protein
MLVSHLIMLDLSCFFFCSWISTNVLVLLAEGWLHPLPLKGLNEQFANQNILVTGSFQCHYTSNITLTICLPGEALFELDQDGSSQTFP